MGSGRSGLRGHCNSIQGRQPAEQAGADEGNSREAKGAPIALNWRREEVTWAPELCYSSIPRRVTSATASGDARGIHGPITTRIGVTFGCLAHQLL